MELLHWGASGLAVGYVLFFLYHMLSGETVRSSIPLELRPILILGKPIFGAMIAFNKSIGAFDQDSDKGRLLRRQLDSAGIDPSDLSAAEFVALQELTALAPVFFLAAVFGGFVKLPQLVPMLALGLIVGAYYPKFKLEQRMRERNALIFAELPYVVDLLSLAIEAGLDFRRAVERLVEFSEPTPLINELRYFLHDVDMGVSTENALKNMSERVHVLAFFSFVEAIIQATQMGVDITPTLHAQAEQMRTTYFQQMEKEANRTPVLILMPTVLCIFPPMLILLLAPAVVKFSEMLPSIQ
jgi:tight adherence protein C